MKLKLAFILCLVALLASGLSLAAQTNAPAADNTQPGVASANPAAPVVTVAANTAPAQDNTAPATNAPAPATPPAAAPATNAPPDSAPATTPAETGAAPASALIPLIVMDEVPLTDAIKNLARQANLNYMLDPKIPYGSIGANGLTNPQPSVSLRWENLTADQALGAVLNNYNLTIVPDLKTKISRITVKDPAAPEPLVTKIIQLKYSDPTNIVVSIQSVLLDKRSRVIADVRTSQLVLVATEKEVVAADELVARLDTQTKEVLIEAKLVELSKNPISSKGLDWSGTLQAQKFTFGNNVNGGQSGNPYSQTLVQTPGLGYFGTPPTGAVATNGILNTVTYGANNLVTSPGLLVDTARGLNPTTAFLNADGVSAVLSFLNSEADAKVLSTPRAVTLDNQEATLSVTTAQPIFATTAGTQGSPGGSQVTYTNLGTILRVTPRISANDTINLKVVPEVSDVGGTVTKTVAGTINQADFYDVRKIETRVLIPSGNTLVMGGLLSDASTKGNTKVPILGDIPVLGWAFRSENKSQNKKNLIIFVTPTIVHDEDFQPTQTDFLKTKDTDGPKVKFGAMDRADPQDWSKLFHGKKADADADGGK
jgi:type II secretory pathway component GspD/PulD (secretin)